MTSPELSFRIPRISQNPFGSRERHTEKKKDFREQLTEVLLERFPESKERTAEELRIWAAERAAREASLNDADLVATLKHYGIDPSRLEKIEDDRYRLPVTKHFTERSLPNGYGYRGGAARALLLRSLGIDPTYEPRDIDIVRYAANPPFPNADSFVSREFMPDDYAHGHGVEVVHSWDDYFATRDLTINEVYATDTEIIATRACVLDSVRHIIRLSDDEYERIEEGGPSNKIFAKALRAYAEAVYRWDEAGFNGPSDWEYDEYFISPFWLALQLDRAFEVSSEVAEGFTRELIRRRQLPDDIQNAEAAAEYLLGLLKDKSFYYRHAPTKQFDLEAEDMHEAQYSHEVKHEGFGKRRLQR